MSSPFSAAPARVSPPPLPSFQSHHDVPIIHTATSPPPLPSLHSSTAPILPSLSNWQQSQPLPLLSTIPTTSSNQQQHIQHTQNIPSQPYQAALPSMNHILSSREYNAQYDHTILHLYHTESARQPLLSDLKHKLLLQIPSSSSSNCRDTLTFRTLTAYPTYNDSMMLNILNNNSSMTFIIKQYINKLFYDINSSSSQLSTQLPVIVPMIQHMFLYIHDIIEFAVNECLSMRAQLGTQPLASTHSPVDTVLSFRSNILNNSMECPDFSQNNHKINQNMPQNDANNINSENTSYILPVELTTMISEKYQLLTSLLQAYTTITSPTQGVKDEYVLINNELHTLPLSPYLPISSVPGTLPSGTDMNYAEYIRVMENTSRNAPNTSLGLPLLPAHFCQYLERLLQQYNNPTDLSTAQIPTFSNNDAQQNHLQTSTLERMSQLYEKYEKLNHSGLSPQDILKNLTASTTLQPSYLLRKNNNKNNTHHKFENDTNGMDNDSDTDTNPSCNSNHHGGTSVHTQIFSIFSHIADSHNPSRIKHTTNKQAQDTSSYDIILLEEHRTAIIKLIKQIPIYSDTSTSTDHYHSYHSDNALIEQYLIDLDLENIVINTHANCFDPCSTNTASQEQLLTTIIFHHHLEKQPVVNSASPQGPLVKPKAKVGRKRKHPLRKPVAVPPALPNTIGVTDSTSIPAQVDDLNGFLLSSDRDLVVLQQKYTRLLQRLDNQCRRRQLHQQSISEHVKNPELSRENRENCSDSIDTALNTDDTPIMIPPVPSYEPSHISASKFPDGSNLNIETSSHLQRATNHFISKMISTVQLSFCLIRSYVAPQFAPATSDIEKTHQRLLHILINLPMITMRVMYLFHHATSFNKHITIGVLQTKNFLIKHLAFLTQSLPYITHKLKYPWELHNQASINLVNPNPHLNALNYPQLTQQQIMTFTNNNINQQITLQYASLITMRHKLLHGNLLIDGHNARAQRYMLRENFAKTYNYFTIPQTTQLLTTLLSSTFALVNSHNLTTNQPIHTKVIFKPMGHRNDQIVHGTNDSSEDGEIDTLYEYIQSQSTLSSNGDDLLMNSKQNQVVMFEPTTTSTPHFFIRSLHHDSIKHYNDLLFNSGSEKTLMKSTNPHSVQLLQTLNKLSQKQNNCINYKAEVEEDSHTTDSTGDNTLCISTTEIFSKTPHAAIPLDHHHPFTQYYALPYDPWLWDESPTALFFNANGQHVQSTQLWYQSPMNYHYFLSTKSSALYDNLNLSLHSPHSAYNDITFLNHHGPVIAYKPLQNHLTATPSTTTVTNPTLFNPHADFPPVSSGLGHFTATSTMASTLSQLHGTLTTTVIPTLGDKRKVPLINTNYSFWNNLLAMSTPNQYPYVATAIVNHLTTLSVNTTLHDRVAVLSHDLASSAAATANSEEKSLLIAASKLLRHNDDMNALTASLIAASAGGASSGHGHHHHTHHHHHHNHHLNASTLQLTNNSGLTNSSLFTSYPNLYLAATPNPIIFREAMYNNIISYNNSDLLSLSPDCDDTLLDDYEDLNGDLESNLATPSPELVDLNSERLTLSHDLSKFIHNIKKYTKSNPNVFSSKDEFLKFKTSLNQPRRFHNSADQVIFRSMRYLNHKQIILSAANDKKKPENLIRLSSIPTLAKIVKHKRSVLSMFQFPGIYNTTLLNNLIIRELNNKLQLFLHGGEYPRISNDHKDISYANAQAEDGETIIVPQNIIDQSNNQTKSRKCHLFKKFITSQQASINLLQYYHLYEYIVNPVYNHYPMATTRTFPCAPRAENNHERNVYTRFLEPTARTQIQEEFRHARKTALVNLHHHSPTDPNININSSHISNIHSILTEPLIIQWQKLSFSATLLNQREKLFKIKDLQLTLFLLSLTSTGRAVSSLYTVTTGSTASLLANSTSSVYVKKHKRQQFLVYNNEQLLNNYPLCCENTIAFPKPSRPYQKARRGHNRTPLKALFKFMMQTSPRNIKNTQDLLHHIFYMIKQEPRNLLRGVEYILKNGFQPFLPKQSSSEKPTKESAFVSPFLPVVDASSNSDITTTSTETTEQTSETKKQDNVEDENDYYTHVITDAASNTTSASIVLPAVSNTHQISAAQTTLITPHAVFRYDALNIFFNPYNDTSVLSSDSGNTMNLLTHQYAADLLYHNFNIINDKYPRLSLLVADTTAPPNIERTQKKLQYDMEMTGIEDMKPNEDEDCPEKVQHLENGVIMAIHFKQALLQRFMSMYTKTTSTVVAEHEYNFENYDNNLVQTGDSTSPLSPSPQLYEKITTTTILPPSLNFIDQDLAHTHAHIEEVMNNLIMRMISITEFPLNTLQGNIVSNHFFPTSHSTGNFFPTTMLPDGSCAISPGSASTTTSVALDKQHVVGQYNTMFNPSINKALHTNSLYIDTMDYEHYQLQKAGAPHNSLGPCDFLTSLYAIFQGMMVKLFLGSNVMTQNNFLALLPPLFQNAQHLSGNNFNIVKSIYNLTAHSSTKLQQLYYNHQKRTNVVSIQQYYYNILDNYKYLPLNNTIQSQCSIINPEYVVALLHHNRGQLNSIHAYHSNATVLYNIITRYYHSQFRKSTNKDELHQLFQHLLPAPCAQGCVEDHSVNIAVYIMSNVLSKIETNVTSLSNPFAVEETILQSKFTKQNHVSESHAKNFKINSKYYISGYNRYYRDVILTQSSLGTILKSKKAKITNNSSLYNQHSRTADIYHNNPEHFNMLYIPHHINEYSSYPEKKILPVTDNDVMKDEDGCDYLIDALSDDEIDILFNDINPINEVLTINMGNTINTHNTPQSSLSSLNDINFNRNAQNPDITPDFLFPALYNGTTSNNIDIFNIYNLPYNSAPLSHTTVISDIVPRAPDTDVFVPPKAAMMNDVIVMDDAISELQTFSAENVVGDGINSLSSRGSSDSDLYEDYTEIIQDFYHNTVSTFSSKPPPHPALTEENPLLQQFSQIAVFPQTSNITSSLLPQSVEPSSYARFVADSVGKPHAPRSAMVFSNNTEFNPDITLLNSINNENLLTTPPLPYPQDPSPNNTPSNNPHIIDHIHCDNITTSKAFNPLAPYTNPIAILNPSTQDASLSTLHKTAHAAIKAVQQHKSQRHVGVSLKDVDTTTNNNKTTNNYNYLHITPHNSFWPGSGSSDVPAPAVVISPNISNAVTNCTGNTQQIILNNAPQPFHYIHSIIEDQGDDELTIGHRQRERQALYYAQLLDDHNIANSVALHLVSQNAAAAAAAAAGGRKKKEKAPKKVEATIPLATSTKDSSDNSFPPLSSSNIVGGKSLASPPVLPVLTEDAPLSQVSPLDTVIPDLKMVVDGFSYPNTILSLPLSSCSHLLPQRPSDPLSTHATQQLQKLTGAGCALHHGDPGFGDLNLSYNYNIPAASTQSTPLPPDIQQQLQQLTQNASLINPILSSAASAAAIVSHAPQYGTPIVPAQQPATSTTTPLTSTTSMTPQLLQIAPNTQVQLAPAHIVADHAATLRANTQYWLQSSSGAPPHYDILVLVPPAIPPPGGQETTDDHQPYCFCQTASQGEMVGCENENCLYGGWFHFQCVGVTAAPRGQWWCLSCIINGLQRQKDKLPKKIEKMRDIQQKVLTATGMLPRVYNIHANITINYNAFYSFVPNNCGDLVPIEQAKQVIKDHQASHPL